jgi:acyl-CoA thioesterase-1
VSPSIGPSVAPATAPDPRPAILFVGTSLTAGYGLDLAEAYPALIQAKLDAAGLRYRVVNAGVSGETSAGALRRIDWLLRQRPAVVVLETGANDGLRGQEPEATRANIRAILEAVARVDPKPSVLLVGMKAVTNYGRDYQRRFESIYPDLAREHGAALLPFLLEGVAGVPALNQADGIHPTAEGQRRIAEAVHAALLPLLGG